MAGRGASAPFVELTYAMQGTGLATFAKSIGVASKELTSKLRWLGRDYLRLGASVNQFATMGQKLFSQFAGASFALSSVMEDLGDVFIDLADAIFDPLEPVLDAIAPMLETLVDIFEMIPAPIRAGFGLFIIVIGVILPLIGKAVGLFTNLQGTIMLAAGALRGIAQEGISFSKAWMLMTGAMKHGIDVNKEARIAALKEIAILKEQQEHVLNAISGMDLRKKSTKEILVDEAKLAETIHAKEKAYAKDLLISGKITAAQWDQVNSGKSLEEAGISAGKGGKQARKGALGWAGGLVKAGIAMAGMSILMYAFQPLFEELSDLFQTVGEAILSVVEPFIPWIDILTELIEQNPQLVGGIILIITGFLTLMMILPQLITGLKLLTGGLGKLFGGLGGAATGEKGVTDNSYMTIFAIAALIAAIAALVASFTLMITLASQNNISMGELLLTFVAFIGALVGFVFGLSFAVKMLSEVGPNVSQAVISLALLTLAIGALVLTFTAFIAVAGMFGFSAQDVITMLFSLVAAVSILVGVMVALGFIVTACQIVLKPLEILLLVIAFAALAIGVAFLLAGIGISMAADAVIRLAQNIGLLVPLIPVLFALAAGMFMLGAAGLVALAGTVGILGLAIAIVALGGAIMLLAAALNAIPDWARGFVGGILGAIGGIFGGIAGLFGRVPGLQKGGVIKEAGVAYLHPGEVVVPPGGGMGRYTDYSTTSITISGAEKSPKEIAAEVVSEINKLQERKYRRTEYGA